MNELNREFLDVLTELLAVPSPPGREDALADIVRKHIRIAGFTPETDPAGNVMVRLKAKNPTAPLTLLAAHIDEIAMVVTGIEENGDLKVINSGGLIPSKLGERPVEIVSDKEENIIGIFSMGSVHSADKHAGGWTPTWKDVRIITGLTPEQLKLKGIRIGSSAVPIKDGRGPYVFGDKNDPLVGAWTFDDRGGVAVLLILLKKLKQINFISQKPLIVAFTVHEEGGCHGAKVLAHRESPETFIAVDGCPVINPESLKLDGRPGIWSKDYLCNYDQRLMISLMQAAEAAGTELQPVVYTNAASDASAVYNAGGAYRVAFLGHVRTNSHGYEVAKLSVFNNTINTLVKYIELAECR